MNERRNSDRHSFSKLVIRETNGDYMFTLKASNLSEDGLFIENKFCVSGQEPFSKLSFTLPNGKQVRNIVARIVREDRKGELKGSAFEFMDVSESDRMTLKEFFFTHTMRGTA